MTFDEAMHWWFGRVNYEVQSPSPADLNLERMRLLLARLGNPHERYPIVHVAGSKGKGSTSAMLAAILAADGKRVGLFTSPHLQNVTERIQVAGLPIAPADFTELATEIQNAAQAPVAGSAVPLDSKLTFFEIATAIGMLHFARSRIDAAVLEVGLGGRFDSTNVCDPLVAIITSISFDHTEQLGNTLAKIAFEKAGIIKPGRPVVSGVVQEEARSVIRKVARERGATLVEVGVDFQFEHEPARVGPGSEQPAQVSVSTPNGTTPWLDLGLVGAHQAANAALAVVAVETLRAQGIPISYRAVADGLAYVKWPARLEIVGRRPLVILDCAHNVASAEALVQALIESFPLATRATRLLIFAGNRDKDLAGMLAVLEPLVDRIYLTRFTSPRCLPPEQLAEIVPEKLRMTTRICPTAAEALVQARRDARPEDQIVAAGSVFLAGALRSIISV